MCFVAAVGVDSVFLLVVGAVVYSGSFWLILVCYDWWYIVVIAGCLFVTHH